MDIDKVFATDLTLEEEGVWVTLDEKSAIKVARIGNKKFQKLSKAFAKNNKIVAQYVDSIPEDAMIRIVAKSILIDWKGIKLKGKKLEYSVENAIKVLKYKDFLDLVIKVANDKEAFRQQEIEEDKETLGKS